MISLCGSCMLRLGARRRWLLVDLTVEITLPTAKRAGSIATVPPPQWQTRCDGCDRGPISSKFPHTRFVAEKADLKKESA